ncbi:hypothetical protein EYF80_015481 [Liparis tanakae]|uniref:Uncharacterized protein n=1 Tax=Liparis tanakae TaxID=230148 RepID=A0A4Z2I8F3_9TELE|nr:hypothetical protein EYF80_015481 [Liparis tanakae]
MGSPSRRPRGQDRPNGGKQGGGREDGMIISREFRNSQLMQIILIMVMVKKASGDTSTLTNTAVNRKTTMMAARLPMIRSF